MHFAGFEVQIIKYKHNFLAQLYRISFVSCLLNNILGAAIQIWPDLILHFWMNYWVEVLVLGTIYKSGLNSDVAVT